MPGQPRTRQARLLALGLHSHLWHHGPARIEDMLEECGCGPSHWPYLSPKERAAVNMAVGRLMAREDVRLRPDGKLCIAKPGRRAA